MEKKCSAVIIGVGPEQDLGATLASYFSAEDLHVFIAERSEDKLATRSRKIRQTGNSVTSVVADATVEHDVAHLFKMPQLDGNRIDIAAYNVDSNISAPLLETETFTRLWRQNYLGAFFFGKEAVKAMKNNQQGTLFFTGANGQEVMSQTILRQKVRIACCSCTPVPKPIGRLINIIPAHGLMN